MITVTLTFQSAAEAAVFLAGRSDPAVMTLPPIDPERSMSAVETAEAFIAQAVWGGAVMQAQKPASDAAPVTQTASAGVSTTEQQPSTESTQSKPVSEQTVVSPTPTADSNKAVAALGATPDYKEIVRCVNALAKKGGNPLALKVLGQFKTVSGDQVNHGNKLQLSDYAAFIETAEGALS